MSFYKYLSPQLIQLFTTDSRSETRPVTSFWRLDSCQGRFFKWIQEVGPEVYMTGV